jgi:hypothetical protein
LFALDTSLTNRLRWPGVLPAVPLAAGVDTPTPGDFIPVSTAWLAARDGAEYKL